MEGKAPALYGGLQQMGGNSWGCFCLGFGHLRSRSFRRKRRWARGGGPEAAGPRRPCVAQTIHFRPRFFLPLGRMRPREGRALWPCHARPISLCPSSAAASTTVSDHSVHMTPKQRRYQRGGRYKSDCWLHLLPR